MLLLSKMCYNFITDPCCISSGSGNCSAGYYCPQGESRDDPHLCWVGHYCPARTATPYLCPSGYYQDDVGQCDCKLCPAGYYCDNSLGVVVINDTVKCPPGYYCPAGQYNLLSSILTYQA